jgi:preprotein translocase subunit SecG
MPPHASLLPAQTWLRMRTGISSVTIVPTTTTITTTITITIAITIIIFIIITITITKMTHKGEEKTTSQEPQGLGAPQHFV